MDNENNLNQSEKIPLGLSIFVTSCVIAMLCIISLAIAKNVEHLASAQNSQEIGITDFKSNKQ